MDRGVLSRAIGGKLSTKVNESSPPIDPTDEELLAQVARQIVRRGLAVPAVFFLESSKPLSYVGSQALLFLEPFVRIFLSAPNYDRFARLLEDRDNYERLIEAIEKGDADREASERAAKAAARPSSGRTRRWQGWFGRGGGGKGDGGAG